MDFAAQLSGGDPRTLGHVPQVTDYLIDNPSELAGLFSCVFSGDEIVRMRASDALEKLCRQKPEWFAPFTEQLLNEWPKIRQASVQWHLAQMLAEVPLTQVQKQQAVTILRHNLATMDDWIVTNLTLESLATFVRDGVVNKREFITLLRAQLNSRHKSVVSRVHKLLKEFDSAK